jgi:hypothetical protein
MKRQIYDADDVLSAVSDLLNEYHELEGYNKANALEVERLNEEIIKLEALLGSKDEKIDRLNERIVECENNMQEKTDALLGDKL